MIDLHKYGNISSICKKLFQNLEFPNALQLLVFVSF